ncbi:MAG: hypothetical protein DRI90_19920 [Deltaproteobacteria bacterium]|nr:MAG: hypothetical protein DRI90_19920 [Deltaproteobacteria bacterium]
MQPCNRTRFTTEFREAAVRRYLSTDIGYRELGEEMGTSPWTLRDWVRKHQGRLVSPNKKETTRSTDERTGRDKLRLLLEARAITSAASRRSSRRERSSPFPCRHRGRR